MTLRVHIQELRIERSALGSESLTVLRQQLEHSLRDALSTGFVPTSDEHHATLSTSWNTSLNTTSSSGHLNTGLGRRIGTAVAEALKR